MTPDILPRPVARPVRVVAILLAVVAVLLLSLGGLTTSFRAGMADPVWPTEPWYLAVNGHVWTESRTGFLLEHTHRAAGWAAGGLASLLALLAWWGAKGGIRVVGLLAIVGLLGTYGDFHRRMMAVWQFRQDHPGEPVVYPAAVGLATAGFAVLLLGVCVAHLFGRERGRWVRALSGILLIAVMIQGLLGGLRVFLDQLTGLTNTVGVELSALHGVFAQVVFSAMVCAALLAARPRPELDLPAADRSRLGRLALALPVAVFVQLLWAVWVRHAPTPLAQRLHFLTAFVVLGLAVWLTVRALATPAGRKSLGFDVRHLIGMLVVQIVLGVEAWMSKFAAAGPDAAMPPEMRPITVASGIIRTLHQLIGTAVLASSVVLALRVWRRSAAVEVPTATGVVPASDPRSRADSLAPVPVRA
jgi:heme a synthase